MSARPKVAAQSPTSPETSGEESSSELLDAVLEATDLAPPEPIPIHGVVVGRLASYESAGWASVEHPLNNSGRAIRARVATTLAPEDAGCDVALVFEAGDAQRPIVIGKMAAQPALPTTPEATLPTVDATVDGRRVTIEAEETLELRCGKASIVLTREGKVLLRGEYVLTRATGTHRIQGGTVEIN